MAKPAQFLSRRKTGWARPYDRNLTAGLVLWRLRNDPALVPSALDDRKFDLLNRYRVGVDRKHARRFARRRANSACELREVVGQVERIQGLTPLAPVDKVIPLWNEVAKRAAVMAERNAAIHAAGALVAKLSFGPKVEVLVVIVDTLRWLA